jgi:hypothetical protein
MSIKQKRSAAPANLTSIDEDYKELHRHITRRNGGNGDEQDAIF